MTVKPLRVLLIDGKIQDSAWVGAMLADLEDRKFEGGWRHGVDIFHLERLSDALTVLDDDAARRQYDVILLNPSLPDSSGLHSYLRVASQVPEIPVVVLCDRDDPDLAISMIRAGAQDFLAKPELDSVPLARALRLAAERSKLRQDLRSLAWRDEMTGLLNQHGFTLVGEHDMATARRLVMNYFVVSMEMDGLDRLERQYGRDERHLALVETAEIMRDSVCATEMAVGRVGHNRFAVGRVSNDPESKQRLLLRLRQLFQNYLRKPNRSLMNVRFGSAQMSPSHNDSCVADLLAKALCENEEISPVLTQRGQNFSESQLAHSVGRDV